MVVLDTLPIERIEDRAANVDWRRGLLLLLIALPLALGWTARKVLWLVGWLAAHLAAAVVEGWVSAGPRKGG